MTTKKDNISHWDNIYATKEIATVSWHQEYPLQSIEIIKRSNLKHDAHIIDVGTGTSRLIPELIANNFVNITLKIKEKMVLIAAREKPTILKLTSLQLTIFWFNCSRSSSFVVFSSKFPALQAKDSLKKPCSIPK